MRAKKMCGGDDAHDHPSGSKKANLPADVQEDIDRAERDSRTVVLDLTEEDSDDDEIVVVGPSNGARVKPDPDAHAEEGARSSSPELEVLPAKAKRSAPPSSLPPAKRGPLRPRSPTAPASSALRAGLSAVGHGASAASTSARQRTSPPAASAAAPARANTAGWTCPLCTYVNLSPLSLACEVCLAERPPSTLPVALAPAPDGWACHACTTVNGHVFWSCKACGTVKRSSAVG